MQSAASPRARSSRADIFLRIAYAALGFALAIAIAPITVAPARDGQLPGFMSANDLDASGPMRAMALAILLPFLAALAASPLIDRLTTRRSRALAGWGAVASLALSIAGASFIVVALTAAATSGLALGSRDAAKPWSRDDVLLIPSALALFALLTTVIPAAHFTTPVALSALTVVVLRLHISLSAHAFGLASAAVSALLLFPHSRLAALAGCLAWIVALLSSRFVPSHMLHSAVAWAALPLFVYSYASIQRPFYAEGIPRINFFEDGHSLLPASEMLRGEMPYRDVVPGHGLVSDGLLDYVSAKIAGDDLGSILRVRERVEALLAVAIYFVGFAATGSGAAGVVAFLLATSIRVFWTSLEPPPTALLWTPAIRSLAALVSLSFVLVAVRRDSARYLAIAAAIAALTVFVSVDFGAYAVIIVTIAAILMSRRQRLRLVPVACGFAAGAVIGFLPLLIAGVGFDFVRVTFREVLSLEPAYSIGYFQFPSRFADYRGLPDLLGLLFVPGTLWFVTWCAIALFTAAWIAVVVRTRLRRTQALLFIGLFITIEAIAYGERLNVHFMPLAAAFAAVALWRLFASRVIQIRCAAVGLLAVVLVMSAPTRHLRDLSRELTSFPADHAQWTTYKSLPRARGALFRRETANAIGVVQSYVDTHLGPKETWLDFANMPALYYLFDRPCPIRQYEVPFYESTALQREVIDRIARDQSVRAVLVSFPDLVFPIDGVSSAVRAPLVARFIQQNFRPDFANARVVFMARNR